MSGAEKAGDGRGSSTSTSTSTSTKGHLETIRPEGWPRGSGYSDGIAAPGNARTVWIAGQIAWDEKHELCGAKDFAAQFRKALENVVAVVKAAGGEARDIASLTVFVTRKKKYLKSRKAVGAAWREVIGDHFPAMALVEVKGLLEPGAVVEIQGVAAIPERGGGKRRIADALRASLEAKAAPAPPAGEARKP